MTPYVIGIIAAFLSVVTHAWANIVDNYFSGKIFDRLTNFIFFSNLLGAIFLPIVAFIDPPHFLPSSSIAIIAVASFISVAYLYPYFWSLRRVDTSVVTSLFSLGKIFAPLLAFLLVGEILSPLQYAGFFVIIISSILLTLDIRKLRIDRAFYLMLTASIILTLQSVLYKFVFDKGANWGSVVVISTIFQIIISGIFVVVSPLNIADFKSSYTKVKKLGGLFVLDIALSWIGDVAFDYSLFLLPVSILKGITSTQPIFVLIFALFFGSRLKKLFKEDIRSGKLWFKIFFLVLTVIGTVLVIV